MNRKRVAIVIGAGSVKCAAALGLWKVLRREGIDIDMVVGCSGGSIYASVMALGDDPETCERLTRELWTPKITLRRNWRSILGAMLPQVFPFQRTVTGDTWQRTEWAWALDRAVGMIPDDVCIEAADNAVPHLVDRTYVGLHGDIGDELSTWMVVDTNVEELGGWDPLTPREALDRAERLGFEPVVEDDHGIWVLHRDRPVDPVCANYVP